MNRTLERRLANVQRAITERRWLETVYVRLDEETPVPRRLRPSHIYRSKEGQIVVQAYCELRRAMRTFRLDRFQRLALGPRAGILSIPKGRVVVYPATWPLVQARPQRVSQASLDKFLDRGWSLQPYAELIEPPEQEGEQDVPF